MKVSVCVQCNEHLFSWHPSIIYYLFTRSKHSSLYRSVIFSRASCLPGYLFPAAKGQWNGEPLSRLPYRYMNRATITIAFCWTSETFGIYRTYSEGSRPPLKYKKFTQTAIRVARWRTEEKGVQDLTWMLFELWLFLVRSRGVVTSVPTFRNNILRVSLEWLSFSVAGSQQCEDRRTQKTTVIETSKKRLEKTA